MTFRKRPTRYESEMAFQMQNPNMELPDAPRYRKKSAHPEADIQKAIVKWLSIQHPNLLVSGSLVGAQLSGGYIAMNNAKQMGVLPGDTDLKIMCPGGKVIFLEVKSEKGTVTEAQSYVHAKLAKLGFPVYVVRSAEDAKEALRIEGI